MDSIKALESMGFALPSAFYMIGSIVFSIIGFAAYKYGKKASLTYTRWIGGILMVFPYAVSETWLLYLIGGGLCIGLYVFRK